MGRINSKKKGNSFELKVSNLLKEELTPLSFQRVLSSGAFLGGKNSARIAEFNSENSNSSIGDIYCSNSNDFKFVIECKSYALPPKFYDLLSENCIIYNWFSEAEFDCKKTEKKLPLLIFKFNRTPIFCCIHYDLVNNLISKDKLVVFNNLCILELSNLLLLGVDFFKV